MGEPQTTNIVKISSSIFIVLLLITVLAGTILANTKVSADDTLPTDSKSATASVNVSAACSMSSTVDTPHSASITPGSWQGNIGQTSMTVTCNDPGGYAIYAVGYSNDEWKNTNLIGTNGSTIGTNTNTSGSTSGWSMKLSTGTAPTTSGGATIISPYNDYAIVPGGSTSDPGDKQGGYAKVATYDATTTGTTGSSLTSTYGAYVSSNQAAGTYTGKVKYTLVHPNDAEPPVAGDMLYDLVAEAWTKEGSRVQTNDTDTNTGIQAAITTANSGVFKYNPSTFGTASDASNDHDIYYYRGILDTTTGSYGSDGDNIAHPNTVLLDANSNGADTSDTCWRIVRTTGSGGVKMIYQGKWTGSTCANATTNAQVAASAFNTSANGGGSQRSIVKVGYTFNSSYTTTTASTPASTLFGTNSSYSGNSTKSTIKGYIEDTWFTNISAYEPKLEPSAGYCNDRTVYNTSNVLQAESTSISQPYGTSTSGYTQYNFGARTRNYTTAQPPSLTCAKYNNGTTSVDRSTVDLYTTSSASNGNKQLSKPAALLTADELSFAGSGSSTASQGSAYHANSYLRSGSLFWLLSPYYRDSAGRAREFRLDTSGNLDYDTVYGTYGVRPSISLTSGTTAASGSGTATDPWIVTPPSY